MISEFMGPSPSARMGPITAGPDGNIWFGQSKSNTTPVLGGVGRATPAGVLTIFDTSEIPGDMTAGSDGNVWFSVAASNRIGRVTPNGLVTYFIVPAGAAPGGITKGPDGNVWFTEAQKIGRLTPDGTFTEFPVGDVAARPSDIAAGPDGNLWFTESGRNAKIGRMTPTGTVTEFPLPAGNDLIAITAGPGGLWFTDTGTKSVGRITTTGEVTEFVVTDSTGRLGGIAAGADGNIWFTETFNWAICYITP